MNNRITRRGALIGGATVVGAAGLYGGVQYSGWSDRDFAGDPHPFPEFEAGEGEFVWRNWGGNQAAVVENIVTPANEEELVDALRKTSGSVRPVGSGHSWSALVPTAGTIVDISRLSGIYSIDKANATATLGAGTRLGQAARLLANEGLAFDNLPDINQQTLAGAFATATHGTGVDLPAMHASIIGFRLVTANGDVIDASKQSSPEIFAAGKVSLGALGIITRYTLQLKPNFALHRKVWAEKIDDLLDRAPELAAKHPFFEFFYLQNTGYAAVIVHDYHKGELTGRPPSEDDDSLQQLKELRDKFGWWPWLRRKAFTSAFPIGEPLEDFTEDSWKLLSTPRPTKVFETEYHVPVEEGIKAFREMHRFLDDRNDFYVPTEFRYVSTDDAWLSPFNDVARNSISFHTPENEDFSLHADVIEPMMLRYGGRPHWGKLHNLDHSTLSDMYPDLGRFNEVRESVDPEGRFLNPHLKSIFGVA